jgi:long-chain fatty acid transport protein
MSVLATALAFGLLGAGQVRAGGIILYEVGTEDIGLAAAGYAARASDASTVFTNPAGMTRLEGQQFQLGTQMLYSNLKFSPGSGTSAALGSENGGHAAGFNGFFPGGGLFYSYSVSRDLKLGFAASGNFGAAVKYDDDWVGRYYTRSSALVGMSMLPSIAYRVNERLSLGASVNAMYGYLKSVTAVNNIVTPSDGKLTLKDTKWGFGGNVGILYEASPGTRFGLTYNSRVKLDFSAPAKFSNIAPGLNALLATRGLLNARTDLGVTVPQQVMGSVVHVIDDKWTVMGNVGWQNWHKFGHVEVSIDSANPIGTTTEIGFKNTWHAAIGAQYRMSAPWRLNFGVSHDTAFQPNGNTVSPMLPANAAWRFGVGAQNEIRKDFTWGVAAEYLRGGTLDVNKQSVLPVAAGGRGNLVGEYKDINSFFLSANFNWKF